MQQIRSAVFQAVQSSSAEVAATVIDIKNKRVEAQRLAALVKDALDKALSPPGVSTKPPQNAGQGSMLKAVQTSGNIFAGIGTATAALPAGWGELADKLDLLASKAWVSAQQEQPASESGSASPGAQASGANALSLFGVMANFYVVESEAVEFDYYQFGYLPNTPRIEGRRTTVSYGLQPGSPMPGALGICRHFADATRQAGGEVLYDNSRNIIVVRIKQGGHEAWAEFACDQDRYRVNIMERDSSQPSATGATSKATAVANTDQKTDKNQKTFTTHNFKLSIDGLDLQQAPIAGHFSIQVDNGPATTLAAPAQCADPPVLLRKMISNIKYPYFVLKQGFVDQLNLSKLNLIDTNIWACHIKDGTLVQGALVTDRPLK